jgi:hypothetical protein
VASTTFLVARDDIRRIRGTRHQVHAQVVDHAGHLHTGVHSYSAVYEFVDETGASHRATDEVRTGTPYPALGTSVILVYPAGHPILARRHRPGLRIFVYAVLIGFFVMSFGLATGWIER